MDFDKQVVHLMDITGCTDQAFCAELLLQHEFNMEVIPETYSLLQLAAFPFSACWSAPLPDTCRGLRRDGACPVHLALSTAPVLGSPRLDEN
jgi:hypothetical protein